MSETRATIRTRAQRLVGTAINATLNEAIKEAHKKLQRKHNYKEMEYFINGTFTAGDRYYTLPDNYKAMTDPEISDTASEGYYRLKGIIQAGIDGFSSIEIDQPVYFRIWLGRMYLYQKPDNDYPFYLEYYRWLDEPPIDDEAYDLDEKAQNFLDDKYEYIVAFAVARGFDKLKKYDLAAKWDARAEDIRKTLEDDDIDNALSGIDLKMEMPG